jgi:DNA-binding transcriptional MerR regulator
MDENQLLSISSFSNFTGISRSTLIYYDEIGLFHPAERGENNYRYYLPQQIITVNLISVLRTLEIPLKQIIELNKNRSPEKIMELLEAKKHDLDERLKALNESYKMIQVFGTLINDGLDIDEKDIIVEDMPQLNIMLGDINNFGSSKSFYETYIQFCEESKEKGLNLSYPVGGYFENMKAFIREPSRPKRFFFVNPDGKVKKLEGKYLVGYVRGFYGQPDTISQRMSDYARDHSISLHGPVYNIYLHDELSIEDPDRYLLQVCVQIK